MLIAADIGGTKTSLGIFTKDRGPCSPAFERTYPSSSFACVEDMLARFLSAADVKPDRGVFAVSGPVTGAQAKPTNLPWCVGIQNVRSRFELSSVRLINDIAAMAHAVPVLPASDFFVLNEGAAAKDGMSAVIAPGTGLGEAFFYRARGHSRVYASEGGHADYPAHNEITWHLVRHLREKCGHVSGEQVCSGRGIVNIYEFLRDEGYHGEPAWLKSALACAGDRSAVIIQAYNDAGKQNSLTTATIDLFASLLGAEAGNLALKVMATGGIYLGGGIPRRILPALQDGSFMDAFTAKGRFAGMMSRIPVRIILNEKTALIGSACVGLGSPPSTADRAGRF